MSVSVRGISSGIDINGIIEELMHLERQPIRRKEAQIERTEQIAELWREVNMRLDTFKRTLPPLLDKLTYTAPVPRSSDENVFTARVSGNPVQGNYRLNVGQLATYHSVAMDPATAGDRIANPDAALDLFGTFYLGTGRPPAGLEGLTFDAGTTGSWLRGNFGAGFQAVVDGDEGTVYALNPEDVAFAAGEEYAGADEIRVYMNAFTGAEDEDLRAELEAYFDEKGWGAIDLESDPLFIIKKDGEEWVAENAAGGSFAFLGDHPLGNFNLRGEIVSVDEGTGEVEEVLAVNNFDFQIRDTLDSSGFITVNASDSMLVVADKINNQAALTGVKASVVMAGADDYRLVLESAYEGSEGFIQAYDYAPRDGIELAAYGNDSILTSLQLLDTNDNSARPAYRLEPEEAQDAIFTLNGLQMTRSSNTFTDAVSGVEITLTGTGPATLEIKPDVDAAMEDISLFVESINEVNAYLRVLQKNEEGPLQGSSDLMRIERQLRTIIHGMVPSIPGSTHLTQPLTYTGTGGVTATASGTYTGEGNLMEFTYRASSGTWRYNGVDFNSGDTVDGVTVTIDGGTPANGDQLLLDVSPPSVPLTYDSLASMGIMADDEEGILFIDDAKLRTALEADAEGIYNFFAREAPRDATGRARGPHGLAGQMKNMVENLIGFRGVVQSRQDYFARQISQYENRIEMLERRMEVREARLVRQFTFMEQYIARIQEQTGLMASFEAMMQGGNDQ